MVVVPQVLELFWSAIEREVEKSGRAASFDQLRRIARRLPYAVRRLLFRSVHARLGGGLRLFDEGLPRSDWELVGALTLWLVLRVTESAGGGEDALTPALSQRGEGVWDYAVDGPGKTVDR